MYAQRVQIPTKFFFFYIISSLFETRRNEQFVRLLIRANVLILKFRITRFEYVRHTPNVLAHSHNTNSRINKNKNRSAFRIVVDAENVEKPR